MSKTVVLTLNISKGAFKDVIKESLKRGTLNERFRVIALEQSLKKLHKDFTTLSEGGAVEGINNNEPWADLAPSTIAYKKIKERGVRGLLNADQVAYWRKVYSMKIRSLQRAKITGNDARKQAAKVAWAATIKRGGTTLKNRAKSLGPGKGYLINVDTGDMKRAILPGSRFKNRYYNLKNQEVKQTKNTATVKVTLPYAKYALGRRPIMPDNESWYRDVAKSTLEIFASEFPQAIKDM